MRGTSYEYAVVKECTQRYNRRYHGGGSAYFDKDAQAQGCTFLVTRERSNGEYLPHRATS